MKRQKSEAEAEKGHCRKASRKVVKWKSHACLSAKAATATVEAARPEADALGAMWRLVPPTGRLPGGQNPVETSGNQCFRLRVMQNVCSCFALNDLQHKCLPSSLRPVSSRFDLFRPKNKS